MFPGENRERIADVEMYSWASPAEQLDTLIGWRDELSSGRHTKCVGGFDGPEGSHCAWGVLYQVAGGWTAANLMMDSWPLWEQVIDANDHNPGDNYAAVIEVLNERITKIMVELIKDSDCPPDATWLREERGIASLDDIDEPTAVELLAEVDRWVAAIDREAGV